MRKRLTSRAAESRPRQFHASEFLHVHSQEIAVCILSLAVAAFTATWDLSSVRHLPDAPRSEAALFIPAGFGLPAVGTGPRSALAAIHRQQAVIADVATRAAKHRLAVAQQRVDIADRVIADDEFDLAAKTVETQHLQGLWSQGAISTEVRDVAVRSLESLMAALGRDRQDMAIAEREVERAAASVERAKASLHPARYGQSATAGRMSLAGRGQLAER